MGKLTLSNSSVGTHYENITRTAESSITTKYLLGKVGSSAEKVAICGASDLPIGVITDEAAAGDDVNVALLGAPDTLNVIAGGAIAAGSQVIPSANGKVEELPTSANTSTTYYVIGVALTSASASGDMIEFISCLPHQHVVAGS